MTDLDPITDFASHVLDVVDSIPPGMVMSYGDIAEYLAEGNGPRQVGRVLAVYGSAVPWWRVIHSDGTPAPGHDATALARYLDEGTPLRSARPPVRVDIRRARWNPYTCSPSGWTGQHEATGQVRQPGLTRASKTGPAIPAATVSTRSLAQDGSGSSASAC